MNKKMIRRGIAGGVCIVVLAAAGFAFYSKGADKSDSQETVQSAKAEKGSISTTVVGTGTLGNGAATDVVVPTGVKVKEVLVSSGDTVTEGQVLATLDEASIASELLEVKENIETVENEIDALSDEADEEGTTEYLEAKVLNGKLSDLTEAETALESLLDSQAITATCAGTISSVNVQADTEVTKSSESSTGSSTGSSSTGNSSTNTVASADTTTTTADSTDSTSTVVKTAASISSSTSAGVATKTAGTGADTNASSSRNTGLTYLTASTSTDTSTNTDASEDYSIDFLSEDGTAVESVITISECNIEVEAPVTGGTPQTEIAETDQYTGTISWNLSTDKFQSGTSYIADIRLTAKAGYEFSDSILPVVKGADVTSQVVESDAGESILQIKAKFSKTASGSGSTSDTGTSGSAAAGAAASGVSTITGNNGNQSGTSGSSASGNASDTAGSGSTGASGSASTGSASAASAASTSSGTTGTSDYSLYETAAFSIASATEASVSINVDELDILSVKEGQTATVTLDALDGQEFEGTITEVSSEASSGNSSAKYPVTITFEKTDDMLLGMSASATIHVSEAEDAVLIPVDALQEKGDSTFVYTKKDSDGSLSGEVEVETGISNGSQVEITSGLEEGDTVYYLKAESSDSSSGMPGGMDGQGGGMPDMNGGEAPSGGQAPSGGAPGGDGGAPSK